MSDIVYHAVARHRVIQAHHYSAKFCDVCGDMLRDTRGGGRPQDMKCALQEKEDAEAYAEWQRRFTTYGLPAGIRDPLTIHPDRDCLYN